MQDIPLNLLKAFYCVKAKRSFDFFFHEKVLLIEWRVQVILLPTFYYVKCKRFGCLTGIFVVRACTHHFFYSKNTFMVHFLPFLFIISLSISLDEKTWIFLRNPKNRNKLSKSCAHISHLIHAFVKGSNSLTQ